jgi:hypothetical protein
MRTDGQTDMTSPICVHFMHFMQRKHNKHVCPLFLVLLDIYVEVINTSVTHPRRYLLNALCIYELTHSMEQSPF